MRQPRRHRAVPSSGRATNLWNIIITEWALDAYLNLKHAQIFTDQEYWSVLRPDVELLRTGIPSSDPKFSSTRFWGQRNRETSC